MRHHLPSFTQWNLFVRRTSPCYLLIMSPKASRWACHSTKNGLSNASSCSWMPPVQDRLDDIRRQQGQPQHAPDVGFVDFLGGGISAMVAYVPFSSSFRQRNARASALTIHQGKAMFSFASV